MWAIPGLRASASGEEAAHPLVEPSLFYDPPYERPLEDEFAWHLVKYLNPITGLRYQQKVETPCGNFWIDFVVEHGGRRIGFECGDVEAGDETEEGAFREALLLGTGAVDVLYHFRGEDLIYRLHDCLLVAARWDPALFSERGRINLDTLASPEARLCRVGHRDTVVQISYEETEAAPAPDGVVIRRLSREDPAAWVATYDRALAHYGVSPDRLGGSWAQSA
jgi:hypothetical protein